MHMPYILLVVAKVALLGCGNLLCDDEGILLMSIDGIFLGGR
jgi:hypothetical protein